MSPIALNQKSLPSMSLDISPLFESLKSLHSGALDIRKLYHVYRLLSKMESILHHVAIDEGELEKAESILATIDDTIDEVEEEVGKSRLFKALLLKRILSKLLTIEFILSNKLADRIGEDR
jgi:hypothetical protein